MQDGGHEVAKPEGAVLAHVPQYQHRQHVAVHLEAHLQQRVLKPLRLQDTRLVLGVILEHGLPILEAAHQVLEVAEFEPTTARALQENRTHEAPVRLRGQGSG